MDAVRFDKFARSLSARASRRTLLGLAALSLAALPASMLEARKRRKRKRKTRPKVVLNAFGCVDVGNACRGNDTLCCSGLCEGETPKKGRTDTSRCVAHGEEGCRPADDFCAGGLEQCGLEGNGRCFLTTGGAGYCAAKPLACEPCQKDTDCEPSFGPGAACIVCEAFCPEIRALCAPAGAPD